MSLNAEELINRRLALPSLPDLFVRLDQAINDPKASLGDIGEILTEDSSLCARLLRIANSGFYSFPHRIDSIQRALTLIGTKQLRDLVLATSVTHLFRGIPGELIDMQRFWRHSVACGIAIRELAAHSGRREDEYFYVLGILHDIGHLLIYQAMGATARLCLDRSQREGRAQHLLEQELIGFDHAQLGGELLAHWDLPRSLSEPIRCHHDPEAAADYRSESATLNLADALVSRIGLGSCAEITHPFDIDDALGTMGLLPEDQQALIERIQVQAQEMSEALLTA